MRTLIIALLLALGGCSCPEYRTPAEPYFNAVPRATNCCDNPVRFVLCGYEMAQVEQAWLGEVSLDIEGPGEPTDILGPLPDECRAWSESLTDTYYHENSCRWLVLNSKSCAEQIWGSREGLVVSYRLADVTDGMKSLSVVRRDGSSYTYPRNAYKVRSQGYFNAGGHSHPLGNFCDNLDLYPCGTHWHVDINRDGRIDVVHPGNYCLATGQDHDEGCIQTYLGTPSREHGYFIRYSSMAKGSYSFTNTASLADLDGDGNLDILRVENSATGFGTIIPLFNPIVTFMGLGDGYFEERALPGLPVSLGQTEYETNDWDAVAGNFDGQPPADVVTFGRYSPDLHFFVGASDGHHHMHDDDAFWLRPGSNNYFVVDLDGDGVDEIVNSYDYDAGFNVTRLVDGRPKLVFEVDEGGRGESHSLLFEDFDHDGFLDVGFANHAYQIAIYRGDGALGFTPWIIVGDEQDGYFFGGLFSIDADGDGALEVGTTLGLWEVEPSGQVTDRSLWLPDTVADGWRGGAATYDVDGDGKNDLITPDEVFFWTDMRNPNDTGGDHP